MVEYNNVQTRMLDRSLLAEPVTLEVVTKPRIGWLTSLPGFPLVPVSPSRPGGPGAPGGPCIG